MDITQGTIINNLKSDKYLGERCYSVIISARCDISNKKISKIYYLTAMEISSWLTSDYGFKKSMKEVANKKKNNIAVKIKEKNLNADVILGLDDERRTTVIKDSITKGADEIIKQIEEYKCIIGEISSNRKKLLHDYRKDVVRFLDRVNKGEETHLFYLPWKAFEKENAHKYGLIIDLEEIGMFEDSDCIEYLNNGIDNVELSAMKDSMAEEIKKKFFIEGDDFVVPLYCIKSPWIELLMQRFSYSFNRIGVDGVSKKDFELMMEEMN